MEEITKPDNGEVKLKPKDLVLTITLSQETGQLTVQAPGNGEMFDEPLSFWMLKKAERFIEMMNAKKQQSRIIQDKPRIGDIFRRR